MDNIVLLAVSSFIVLTGSVLLQKKPKQVKEGFGNQINLYWDRRLNLGPSAQKSDTLPLDRQVS
uniref:Uncharacterized protein n=1 Tax=Timema tahoe TaxID=61484 RepID=A0A7R9P1K2_9NEOP|nr:unnamed protein product [Timema tahoe]